MTGWQQDRGQTTLPCIYIPFNEVDPIPARSNAVPCRVGYTTLTVARTSFPNAIADLKGHVYFNDTDSHASSARFSFGNPIPSLPASRHDLVLSPAMHIGKHILTSFKIKLGKTIPGPADYKNLLWANVYSGRGGYVLSVRDSDQRISCTMYPNDNDKSGTTGKSAQSAAGMFPRGQWLHLMMDWDVLSANQMIVKIYIAALSGEMLNGGSSVLTLDFDRPIPDLSVDSIANFIGYQGGIELDIKDYLALVTPDDPMVSIIPALRTWYKNPDNEYQFPDFLRAPVAKAAPRKVEHYFARWTLNGDAGAGKAISNMYDLWLRWGVQNSAFDGILLGIGISSFQPSAGVYLINEIRDFADWLHARGAKLAIMVNDQTYTGGQNSEIPDHFPHWRTRVTELDIRRVVTYWDEIDTFDVQAEIFANPDWRTYNPAKAASGTYRWFHHVWTLVDALKDKPAFAGITTGETSGSAIVNDTSLTNINGVSNRRGIYGITDSTGTYQLSKCYTLRKQIDSMGKLMQMVAHQLRGRPDVNKAVQINSMRYNGSGTLQRVRYNSATQLFTTYSVGNQPYADGDAVFIDKTSWQGELRGFEMHKLYYVRNTTPTTWQLSLTIDGPIIDTFDTVISTDYVYLIPINNYLERILDKSREATKHNGFSLAGQTRALRWLGEYMHEYGFIPSGPDTLMSGLESPYYYLGPELDGSTAEVSQVEAVLAMQHGRWIFSDIPLGRAEIQAQESVYADYKDARYTQILPAYGPYYGTRYSLEQANRYAADRLQVERVTWYVQQDYPQKALPDLIREISRH